MKNCIFLLLVAVIGCQNQINEENDDVAGRSNFVIIYTDDQRYDALGCHSSGTVITPTLDSLCANGMYFENAFATLSICSPSRAALLTGRYGSSNGVTTFGKVPLNEGETTFAQLLKNQGYRVGIIGKWHLADSPAKLGFNFATHFFGNGPWYNRDAIREGAPSPKALLRTTLLTKLSTF